MTVCAKTTYIATIYKSQGCEFNKMIGKWTHWKSRLRLSILTANGESGVYTWTFGCMHARRATQLQHESSHGCGITWLRVSSRSQFIYKLTICRPFIAPYSPPTPRILGRLFGPPYPSFWWCHRDLWCMEAHASLHRLLGAVNLWFSCMIDVDYRGIRVRIKRHSLSLEKV